MGITLSLFCEKNKEKIMTEKEKSQLITDGTGLLNYEYIIDNLENGEVDLAFLLENIVKRDITGQYIVSITRYLSAVNREKYASEITHLIAVAIERDKERRYIGALLTDIWGADYASRVDELNEKDDNFRRIYKRIYPKGI